MKRFLIMPDGGKWKEVMAYTAKGAYASEGSWYGASTKVAVYDPVTGIVEIYSRTLDKDGNVVEIKREVM